MSLNSRVFMELQVRVGRYLERRLGLVQPRCQVLELGALCQGLSSSHERDQEAESKHPCCVLTARGNVVRRSSGVGASEQVSPAEGCAPLALCCPPRLCHGVPMSVGSNQRLRPDPERSRG